MKKIIDNAIKRLNKNSTLDEIKMILKEECEKVTFSINGKDWNNMFDEILIYFNK